MPKKAPPLGGRQVLDHSFQAVSMSMNLPAAEAAEVRAKYGPVFTAVQQVVVAGSIDEEDNFFEAEADGEGLDIDEVSFPSPCSNRLYSPVLAACANLLFRPPS
jgi:hypothetical protein